MLDHLKHAAITLVAATAICIVSPRAEAQEAVIIGAGDIAESGGRQRATSNLVMNQINSNPGTMVFTAGDNAHPSGTASNFSTYYAPSWGRLAIKSRTFPTPGHHDYRTSGASGYYNYFGSVASKSTGGFHVRQLGSYWTGVFLNSETGIASQTTRLRAALTNARTNRKNVFMVWHKPRFAIGSKPAVVDLQAWWRLADEFDVDVIITGHEHFYARIGPRGANGATKPDGTREFVVGTGGAGLRLCGNLPAMAERCVSAHGVLVLKLQQDTYAWEFRDVASRVRDSGIDRVVGVHPSPPPPPPPPPPLAPASTGSM
jgi:hypothetical protein